MDKSDGVGGKRKDTTIKMSESSDVDGKVNKDLLVETLKYSVINKVLA